MTSQDTDIASGMIQDQCWASLVFCSSHLALHLVYIMLNYLLYTDEMPRIGLHLRDNNPTCSSSRCAHNLSAIDSLDDLGFLREAALSCKYVTQLNRSLRIAYEVIFLILRCILSRRTDIMRTIFVA